MQRVVDWILLLEGGNTAWWSHGGSTLRIVIAPLITALLLYFAWKHTVRGKDPRDDTGLFVGYIAYFAIVCGACFAAIATSHWPTVFLIAGGCLGVGFVFGLLFGYPLSDGNKKNVAEPGPSPSTGANQAEVNAAAPNAPAAKPPVASAPPAPTGKNLMQQSADSLSKVIAGATLVEYQKIAGEFRAVSYAISRCAGDCCANSDKAFGAGVTLYFFALGFLIGLFLLPLYNLEPGDHSNSRASGGRNGSDLNPGGEVKPA
jgi:hypothetical protein